jgi:hypothetical protein
VRRELATHPNYKKLRSSVLHCIRTGISPAP